eukprot:scaffold159819_cov22-Tisochrysis_lutea.AAC.3
MLRLHTGCMVARQVCLARYLMSRWQMHRFDHPQRDVNEPLTTVDKLICLNALQGKLGIQKGRSAAGQRFLDDSKG